MMERYARLKEVELVVDTDDCELFEVGDVGVNFTEKVTVDGELMLTHSSEEERAQQKTSIRNHIFAVPSTEILHTAKLQYSKGYLDKCRAHQQQEEEQQNPNVRSADPTTQPAVVAICSHSSIASGTSLQELQGRGVRPGASVSGRWVGRVTGERSGKCRAPGCESCHHRDNPTSFNSVCRGAIPTPSNNSSTGPPSRSSSGPWAPPSRRGTPYRGREPLLDRQSQETFPSRAGAQSQNPQPQDKQCCTLHSSCNDVRSSERFSRESSPREGLSTGRITAPEHKTLPPAMQLTSDSSHGSCVSHERNPTFQRSNSARAAPGLPRSRSITRDTASHLSEMCIENSRDHPASRVAHSAKHRVSFSLTENHELETEKLREKLREPTVHSRRILQAKQDTHQQPLRYNYDQPGFVEREKENVCSGKAYTIYGVKEGKACAKESSVRQHEVARTFSVREKNTNYVKIPRAYSVNAGGGRHLLPMECDTCGKDGIGFVFLGVSGNVDSFCKGCQSGSEWSCSGNKPPKKKKSIMEYCRKLLRLPQKSRRETIS